jgi:hypothetical protein
MREPVGGGVQLGEGDRLAGPGHHHRRLAGLLGRDLS